MNDSSTPTITLAADSLVDLVERIGDGNLVAEAALIERCSPGLRVYIRRLRCPEGLVDDLHQETFRVVLERLRGQGIEDPLALAGFLRGTAKGLFFNLRRKNARRRTEADDEAVNEAAAPDAGQLHRLLDAEAASLVRRLLADLEPPRDREILYRFYIAEDRKETICSDLKLTSLHFNRVVHRARRRFRQLVESFQQQQGHHHA